MRAMTRRALALVLTLAMALSLCLAAQAAGPQVTVTLDGTALELEVPAYIDGRTGPRSPPASAPSWG